MKIDFDNKTITLKDSSLLNEALDKLSNMKEDSKDWKFIFENEVKKGTVMDSNNYGNYTLLKS